MNFKCREHFIYIVLAIIVGLLINEGVFLLILLGAFYFKRFPKTYWIYFLISLLAVVYVNVSLDSLQLDEEELPFIESATVIEIKKRTAEKQVAKVKTETGMYYLTLQALEPKLYPGNIIVVNEEVNIVKNPTVPHAFNFRNYLYANQMKGTIYLSETTVTQHHPSLRYYQALASDYIKEHYPPLTATYLQSWILGIRDDLSDEVTESYSNLGIIHLFAVSGLHVGLLVGIVSYLLKRCGMIVELVDGVMMLFIVIFIALSGASASIVRAGGMAILAILNHKFKWKLSRLDIFSIIFIINFIIFPLQVYQTGFIYSYWLTFCLLLSQSLLSVLPVKSTFFIIPLLAQMAVLPIQVAQNFSFNPLTYFPNLLLIPLVSTFLIPALLLTLVVPALAVVIEGILSLFEAGILWIDTVLDFQLVVGSLSLSAVIFLACLLLLLGWFIEARKFNQGGLVLITFLLLLVGNRWMNPHALVTFLDVGQGDSIVLQSPYQRCTIVVDTGGKISFTGEKTSIFNNTLKPYLLGEGVNQIDYLILTHGDFDHIGEADEVLETFKVKHLVIPKDSERETLHAIVQMAKARGVDVLTPKAGEQIVCGNQTLTFVQSDAPQADENDRSLVTLVEIEEQRFLLTGDISTAVEKDVLHHLNGLEVDIYKAAHHGSVTSNSAEFLNALHPKISVISSGKNNRYGHPSKEVIDRLHQLKIPYLNTQSEGSIQFLIKNQTLNIKMYN